MKKLFLDDVRVPKDCLKRIDNKESIQYYSEKNWNIVRTYNEFVSFIQINGIPDVISFDHDLGDTDEKTGYDCAKWMCNYCVENALPIPKCFVHSMNPVGKNNIIQLIFTYEKKLN